MIAKRYSSLKQLFPDLSSRSLKKLLDTLLQSSKIYRFITWILKGFLISSPSECFFVHRVSVPAWSVQINNQFVIPSATLCFVRQSSASQIITKESQSPLVESETIKQMILKRLAYSVVSNPGVTLVREDQGIHS